AGFDALSDADRDLPDVAAQVGAYRALGRRQLRRRFLRRLRLGYGRRFGLPQGDLGLEGGLLRRLERVDVGRVLGQEAAVRGEIEIVLFDAQRGPSFAEVFPQDRQLGLGHRIEADLVEEAQQPWLAVPEHRVLQELVPDRQRAPDQLVAAGRIHAVDAHVYAADAHRAFGSIGARRVVLRCQQA